MIVPVTLEAMGSRNGTFENAEGAQGKPRWGLCLSDLTPDVRQQIGEPSDVKATIPPMSVNNVEEFTDLTSSSRRYLCS